MSVRVMAQVMDESESTGNDRLVLLVIADEADDDGTSAFPSQDRIAHKSRIPRRTVQRCLSRLEEAGEVVIVRPGEGGRGRFNRYELPRYAWNPGEKGRQSDALPEADVRQKGAEGSHLGGALPIDPQTQEKERALTLETARDGPDPFDAWWERYPRKTNKQGARKAWGARLREGLTPADLERALDGYLAYVEREATKPEFVMHAATFLGPNERWRDYFNDSFGKGRDDGEGPRPSAGYEVPWDKAPGWWKHPDDIGAREQLAGG